jgi:hypothetical protein
VNPFRRSGVVALEAQPMNPTPRFLAHTRSGHGHVLPADSAAEAALAFAEAHAPWAEDDALQVIVQPEGGGPEHCFTVHLDDGEIEPCD